MYVKCSAKEQSLKYINIYIYLIVTSIISGEECTEDKGDFHFLFIDFYFV